MVPYCRLGGEKGLKLTRIAFAAILKFNQLTMDFTMLLYDYESKKDELKGDIAALKAHL